MISNVKTLLANAGVLLMTFSVLAQEGPNTETKVIQNTTGEVRKISGGIITNENTQVAFFVVNTTCGDFTFNSVDTRKPQKIVEDFQNTLAGFTNKDFITINIYNSAYSNWQVYQSDKRIFFGSSSFWITDFKPAPTNFAPIFVKSVKKNFALKEKTVRSLSKAAIGP
jgi:hypothetical protein